MTSYEEIRRRNLAENRRILGEMGVPRLLSTALFKKKEMKPSSDVSTEPSMKNPRKSMTSTSTDRPRKRVFAEVENTEGADENEDSGIAAVLADDSLMDGCRRRSARNMGKRIRYSGGFGHDDGEKEDVSWQPGRAVIEDDSDEYDEEGRRENRRPKMRPGKLYVSTGPKVEANRPNFYGPVEGIDVGTVFPSRLDSCAAGVHRPTVAGIHGGPDGAYSLALSGGYEDDVDLGDRFTYTGEGGRDLKGTRDKPKNLRTAPQSCDQKLVRGNAALVRSVETGNSVRVLRGYKLTSEYAPEEGYRYDGLYSVEKWWDCIGFSGFKVFKFALRRLDDQVPPPWIEEDEGQTTETTVFKNDVHPGETDNEPADKLLEDEKSQLSTADENKDQSKTEEEVQPKDPKEQNDQLESANGDKDKSKIMEENKDQLKTEVDVQPKYPKEQNDQLESVNDDKDQSKTEEKVPPKDQKEQSDQLTRANEDEVLSKTEEEAKDQSKTIKEDNQLEIRVKSNMVDQERADKNEINENHSDPINENNNPQ